MEIKTDIIKSKIDLDIKVGTDHSGNLTASCKGKTAQGVYVETSIVTAPDNYFHISRFIDKCLEGVFDQDGFLV